MKNSDLIAIIQAEEEGKKIECRAINIYGEPAGEWVGRTDSAWNTRSLEYRTAEERPKVCKVTETSPGLYAIGVDLKAGKKYLDITSKVPVTEKMIEAGRNSYHDHIGEGMKIFIPHIFNAMLGAIDE